MARFSAASASQCVSVMCVDDTFQNSNASCAQRSALMTEPSVTKWRAWSGTVAIVPKQHSSVAVAPMHVCALPYLESMRTIGSVRNGRCACTTRHEASPRDRCGTSAPRMLRSASATGSSCVRIERSTYARSAGTPRPSRYAQIDPSVTPKEAPQTCITCSFRA